MCGIVCYFGRAENSLTRILAGMSAIIYRAPDSTGVGVFGNDRESMVAVKSVGDLTALINALVERPLRSNPAEIVLHDLLPCPPESPMPYREFQRRLLAFEALPVDPLSASEEGDRKPPTFRELLQHSIDFLQPGLVGRPGPPPVWPVRGRRGLVALVETLLRDFDLSTTACKILIARSIEREYRRSADQDSPAPLAPLSEILESFDTLFERVIRDRILGGTGALRPPAQMFQYQAHKSLWRLLSRITVELPPDCDQDGVRCLFWFLDAAVMARFRTTPGMDARIQKLIGTHWPSAPWPERLSWKDLYWAEKTLNVYGRAAAAVFAYACEEFSDLIDLKDPGSTAGPEKPKRIEDVFACLATPVIAHGRWALQSPITLENAHPFFDTRKHRAVVLNGQFDGAVEARLLRYLTHLGLPRRSANSAEYLPLLWEHYYDVLSREKVRCETMRRHIEAGLEDLDLRSQSLDYRIFKRIHGKSPQELDEMAFREAVGRMVSSGGQLAVAALSVVAPHRLYVASHDRPLFIMQRPDTGEVMVVSDVNAGLGLFPQWLILERSRELARLNKIRKRQLAPADAESKSVVQDMEAEKKRLDDEEDRIRETFRVRVIPLEGEELVATIDRVVKFGQPDWVVRITDLAGKARPEVEPFDMRLDPIQTRREIHRVFYETHLNEIPDRLEAALKQYLPEPDLAPVFHLHERSLRRRFGRRMEGLRRIVLAGMGSSYNAGHMVRPVFESLIPGIPVDVVRPVEVENVAQFVDHEKDLVCLLSVTGTSADMVHFAKELARHQVSMIGVTEKPYADMALIARKSGGVIPILSGEEVTYSALKSTVSVMFACHLIALWLAHKSGLQSGDRLSAVAKGLVDLPDTLRRVLNNGEIEEFSRRVSERSVGCQAAVVFDDMETSGVGREAAMKLEENSWSASGKALDYRDISTVGLEPDPGTHCVLVYGTRNRRRADVMETMALLHLAGIPFGAVTHEQADIEPFRFYSQGAFVALPSVDDELQPFVDVVFTYRFAYAFGVAHGHRDAGFPRNRAKSVTVARSRPARVPSPASERLALEAYTTVCAPVLLPDEDEESAWERRAATTEEAQTYKELRRLAACICQSDPLSELVTSPEAPCRLLEQLFEDMSEGGEVVLVPLDRAAEAVLRDVAANWNRLSQGVFRVAHGHLQVPSDVEDQVLIVCTTENPDPENLPETLRNVESAALWIGPRGSAGTELPFNPAFGRWHLCAEWDAAAPEVLYVVLNQILITAWKRRWHDAARVLEQTFRLASKVISDVLNASDLRDDIEHCVRENAAFQTALFVGSHGGVGLDWAGRLDRSGRVLATSCVYGESAHGPIVTVDPDPESKFVRLQPRSEMFSLYGAERVRQWEAAYLNGTTVDQFLERADPEKKPKSIGPFFSEGNWYLPVLRKDYDPTKDNLIFLDASDGRDLPKALDELALYGCRYARVVLISQAAFRDFPEMADCFSYPVGHVLWLPPLEGEGLLQAIPGLLLPLAMRIVATAVSACFARVAPVTAVIPQHDTVFQKAFGPLGDLMRSQNIRLRALPHTLVEGLVNLAPLVHRVEGVSWYNVARVENLEELEALAEEGQLCGAERAVVSFRELEAKGYPFFLVRPERENFQGVAATIARETFSETYWGLWYEVYGSSWRCLYQKALVTGEGPYGEPRIELPLLEIGARSGRLYHFYVQYRPWNSAESFEEQIALTVRALGKHATRINQVGSRYEKIVSRFNQAVVADGLLWTDALLILVPRAFALCKPSKDVAWLLTDRTLELLSAIPNQNADERMAALERILARVWECPEVSIEDDQQRWPVLKSTLFRLLERPSPMDG
ncbi:SIS domain-containing protein [Desulfosoma caldarium]|uniref:Glutamine--fructose-6-phosphate aminotransferase [isomerizing] n=1 Tax=Desulfosoma caldarium TaxID=610254 RepID=A0A3N1UQY1_9BACT|nr:SIS domain-containing protein [Desulfosoma caldarium]